MKVRDVLARLRDDGWFLVTQRGSHRQFKHAQKAWTRDGRGHEQRCGAWYTEEHLDVGRIGDPMNYAIVIERAGSNYSAYAPDLPGCVATGASIDEIKERMAEAIAMHIEGMREDGIAPPAPTAVCDHVAVSA